MHMDRPCPPLNTGGSYGLANMSEVQGKEDAGLWVLWEQRTAAHILQCLRWAGPGAVPELRRERYGLHRLATLSFGLTRKRGER